MMPANSMYLFLRDGLSKVVGMLRGGSGTDRKLLMSWRNAAFHRFLVERDGDISRDLSSIDCPSVGDLVSVILPVYNGAQYVAESIDSVLKQSHGQFELIIVNDGSTDSTSDILARYKNVDARIKIIDQENAGLPNALNRGFVAASGEFLTWTSDDNRMRPQFLANMVADLRDHPRWDCVYSNYDLIDEHGDPASGSETGKNFQSPPGSPHVVLPPNENFFNTLGNQIGPAFMYRDRVYRLLGDFEPVWNGCEDFDYWMRINLHMTLRHATFAESFYEYRAHEQSMTSVQQVDIQRKTEALKAFDVFRRDLFKLPLDFKIEIDGHTGKMNLYERDLVTAAQEGCNTLEVIGGAGPDPELLKLGGSPAIYIFATDRLERAARKVDESFAHALKVFLFTGSVEDLPDEVHVDWDLCVVSNGGQILKKIDDETRGWLCAFEPRDLASVCQILAIEKIAKEVLRNSDVISAVNSKSLKEEDEDEALIPKLQLLSKVSSRESVTLELFQLQRQSDDHGKSETEFYARSRESRFAAYELERELHLPRRSQLFGQINLVMQHLFRFFFVKQAPGARSANWDRASIELAIIPRYLKDQLSRLRRPRYWD